ncbi:M28 family peptidase [Kineococcus sp. SYSU DK005]|uniref:M28 family peptidase n=1 Tax=Kineococcus sp. SYSU DK005 TaxID=3383126 RepID=UPI003D7DA497
MRVLSERIGPRIGGTASERAAADYVAAVLDRHGWRPRFEPFPVADKFLAQLTGEPGLPQDLCWQAGASPAAGLDVRVSGPVVDGGTAEPAGEWVAAAAGAVVLVDDPGGAVAVRATRDARVATALAAGAVAVVLLPPDLVFPRRAQASSPALGTEGAPFPPTAVPVVGVAQAQKERLRAALAAGPLRLGVSTTAHRGLTSVNVVGELRGRSGPDGPVVGISAHYDSVIGAPGANDDGSGTGLCLELARVLRTLPPAGPTLRIALWGSEEQGLIGSRHHVAQLDQAQRDRIVAVLQNDMVATSWDPATRYWRLSFDGSDNAATRAVGRAAERLGYTADLSPVTQRGASDHQSFQEVGIASANFSWRGEESPALLEPPYHSPEDTIEKNISYERYQVSLELIGAAAVSLLHSR